MTCLMNHANVITEQMNIMQEVANVLSVGVRSSRVNLVKNNLRK